MENNDQGEDDDRLSDSNHEPARNIFVDAGGKKSANGLCAEGRKKESRMERRGGDDNRGR